jgi:hypothetical protein
MEEFLHENSSVRDPDIDGKILSVSAAELLGSAGPTNISVALQKLPDDVANALGKHSGDLNIKIRSLTPFAAKCLAQRKYRKNSNWQLTVNLDRLDAAEAEELARTRYPLSIFVNVTKMSDIAAEALSKYKGDISLNGLPKTVTRRLIKEKARDHRVAKKAAKKAVKKAATKKKATKKAAKIVKKKATKKGSTGLTE